MMPAERRTVASLATVYLIRMLGLFLLLPVLAIHASGFTNATPMLIGLAMGAYGLTQAVLQIPFGRWSDRYGRKPVIAVGLTLFIAGSVLGALSEDLYVLIVARALQGGGAISAAVTALLADQTRDVVRTRAMALIGISIGLAFVASLVAAPVLDTLIGVPGMFWLMAGLGIAGLAVTAFVVPPESAEQTAKRGAVQGRLVEVAFSGQLLPFYAAMFTLHYVLTATFLAVPLMMIDEFGLDRGAHWKVYLGTFIASLTLTVPMILGAERLHRPATFLVAAMLLTAASQLLLAFEGGAWIVVLLALVLFFGAVNFLEAQLPALLSRAAPEGDRGAALGVFATGQFIGTFFGGVVGGVLMRYYGLQGVFLGAAVVAVAWTIVAPRIRVAPAGSRAEPAPVGPADSTADQSGR
ncbi:MAG TPA: MFS transporter [Steroidobacteraceae bacterium]|nr:MFS transporter [Steroidobacteraceae bacterium]